MKDYRAFMAMSRHWPGLLRDGRAELTLLDFTGGELDRLLCWVAAARTTLDPVTGLHLYWFCPLGQLPEPPAMFAGDWFEDLPGVHRVQSLQDRLTLTVVIGRPSESAGGVDPEKLAADLIVKADLALVLDLDQPVDAFLHPGALVIEPERMEFRTVSRVSPDAHAPSEAWLPGRPSLNSPEGKTSRVLVVGAGIAGMTLAAVLSDQGFEVTVLDARDPLGSDGVHHGHLAAALTPVVSADDNVRSRLSRAGALLADRLWRSMPKSVGWRCGALQLQRPANAKRQVDLESVAAGLGLPRWARWVDASQAGAIAGQPLDRGGLWMPGGWVIRVPSLLQALGQRKGLTVHCAHAHQLTRQAGQWCVLDPDGDVVDRAPVVVLANAGDALSLLQRSGLDIVASGASGELGEDSAAKRLMSMHRLAGEITLIPATDLDQGPRCIVGGDGYVLPAIDGWCVSGGTYVRGEAGAEMSARVTEQGRAQNVERAASLLNRPDLGRKMTVTELARLPGWAGWRAVVSGRLPVVGLVPTHADLYLCTAGASRGLTWSALQAHLIADHLLGRGPALERSLLSSITPQKM